MANTNYTRASKFNQKRTISFFTAELNEAAAKNALTGDIIRTSDNELIGKLPPNSIIMDAWLFTKVAGDAATSIAMTLGTTEGGSQIFSAANGKALGKSGTFTTQTADTGTGVSLFLGRTVTGAGTNIGKYIVVVQYLEYTKETGELTNFVSP